MAHMTHDAHTPVRALGAVLAHALEPFAVLLLLLLQQLKVAMDRHEQGLRKHSTQANVMCSNAGYCEVINTHTVGFLMIPRASIKQV